MKKAHFLLLFISCLFIGGCSSDKDNQEEEWALVQKKYQEIIALSTSVSCEDATEWKIASVVKKSCNSTIYIAYSVEIDEKELLRLMDEYVLMSDKYHEKWGFACTAEYIPPPVGVECKDGKPVFIYSHGGELPGGN